VLVLVDYLCPFSVHVVATFSGTVLFPLLCSVLPFLCIIHTDIKGIEILVILYFNFKKESQIGLFMSMFCRGEQFVL